MLIQKQIKLIVYILSSLIILINSQTWYVINSTDPVNNADYSTLYRIPHSKVKAYAQGGEQPNCPLSNALNYNWDNIWTVWRALHLNGENFTTDEGEVITNFINNVQFTFEKNVTVNRLVYQVQYNMVGYPTEAKIYYAQTDSSDYILLDTFTSERQREKVMFYFSRPVTCKKIKFEFVKMNGDFATATEFQFYQIEKDEVNQAVNLFSDYAQTAVKNEITFENLTLINEVCKTNINYEDELYPFIKRAQEFKSGSKVFDPKREFSTNPKAKNVIRRNGDLKTYMNSQLRMIWAGTNKQPIGIYGIPGETITVYVTVKDGDKIPKIKFTQHEGYFGSWQTSDQDLKVGKNVFTFPNLINDAYSYKPVAGGPIYLVNYYTEDEQSEEVKVYIEGGHFFPFYIRGKSEEDFYNYLSQYVLLMEKDPNTYLDLMELWGERMILTSDAKRGYNTYNNENGPNHNLETWDEYLKHLYRFNGVKYEENEQYYDKKNYWANNNIRHTQPYGAAYAIGEHVGIFYEDWLRGATYISSVSSLGWGFAHEIGHTMDISERTVSETTNNMEAKYDECYLRRDCTRGDYADNLLYLTPEGIDNSLRRDNNYYWKGGDNFLFWWQIETLFPGYWGKLDNMYRYNNTNDISGTEKQAYFSSIITGLNMSYYYERYGFYLGSEQRFTYSNATETFKELMQKLFDDGIIINKIVKFWYLSGPTYMYIVDNNKSDSSGCYKNNKDKINIVRVFKVNDGYSLILPTSECQGHLGFEIYENDKIINFTYSRVFTDKIKYDDNYVPKYKIRAYDKLLEYNDISDSKSIEKGSQVCIYNSKYYDSIAEAIKEIPTDTTATYEITLKKTTYENQIEINANVIIKLDQTESNELKIVKAAEGYIFKVNSGKNLTLIGNNENDKLVVDGDNLSQSGSLIENNGILQIKYVKLCNSIHTGGGGAINNGNGKLYIYNSLFENNKVTGNGGAIYINNAGGVGEITDVTFRGNTAEHGGSFYNIGTLTLTNCIIENNSVTKNGAGAANDGGGILTLSNSQILNNKASGNGGGIYIDGLTTIKNTIIKNNIASGSGGGIFGNGSHDKRTLTIQENTIISNNTAINGGGIFINRGITNYNSLSIYDNTGNLGSNTCLGGDSPYPTLYIKGKDNKLEGEIYRNPVANLYVDTEMFSLQNANKPLILKTNINDNDVEYLLVKSNNYVFSNDDLKLFTSAMGTLFLSNNSEIWFRLNNFDLIYKSEGKTTKYEYHYGETVTINYTVPENKYITKISDNKGKTYNIGDKVTINNSLTITVETKDYYRVILDFIDEKVTFYAKPNADFYFPLLKNNSDDKIILSWTDTNGNLIFDKVYINKNDMNFHANYYGYLYIKFTKDNERLFYNLTECNTTFIIPDLNINVPENSDLSLECNGKKYQYNQSIVVNENMNFIIKVTERSSNSFLIGFSIFISIVILLVAAFFIYRFIKLKKSKSECDIEENVGLVELKE